jgi:hypothetical protein
MKKKERMLRVLGEVQFQGKEPSPATTTQNSCTAFTKSTLKSPCGLTRVKARPLLQCPPDAMPEPLPALVRKGAAGHQSAKAEAAAKQHQSAKGYGCK